VLGEGWDRRIDTSPFIPLPARGGEGDVMRGRVKGCEVPGIRCQAGVWNGAFHFEKDRELRSIKVD